MKGSDQIAVKICSKDADPGVHDLLAGQGDLSGREVSQAGGRRHRRRNAGAPQLHRVGQHHTIRAIRTGISSSQRKGSATTTARSRTYGAASSTQTTHCKAICHATSRSGLAPRKEMTPSGIAIYVLASLQLPVVAYRHA